MKITKKPKINIFWKSCLAAIILLLTITVISYVLLYFLLPHYYEKYKTGQFDALIESLIDDIKESGSDKMEGKLLLDFAKANNVSIMLYDNDENVLLSYSYESALTVQEDTAFMGDTDSTELSIEQADGENSENSNGLELSSAFL